MRQAARDFAKLRNPKVVKCGAARDPGNQTRPFQLPGALLPSTSNSQPPNPQTALTMSDRNRHGLRHAKPEKPFEMHFSSIQIEIHNPHSHSHRRRAPSQPKSFAPSTLHARRLPHSSPTPVFRKECHSRPPRWGLDPRSTSQLRSCIRCLQACRAWELLRVNLLSVTGRPGPVGANWSRNLTLSILLVPHKVLRS